jgi:ABC-2 type transport system ATP-binding protein
MNSDVLIGADHLYRYYGNSCAVRDLSFQLYKGQVLGFLGPNGAGKSTTMGLLTGNLAPDAGQIFINGRDLLDDPRGAKRAIGYLPEQPPVYRELNVDEYLTYCARLHRVPRCTAPQAVQRAKQRCGLESVGKRLIGNLSKGYQQRVGLAQAIVHSPAVIILDEPTVGLDPIQIREIRALIGELGQDHGVILSTHILSEVHATCTHVQIIHQGRLVYSNSLGELNQQCASLILGCDSPPTSVTLSGLPNVDKVEQLSERRFRLHHHPDADPVPALVHRAHAEAWGLRQLTPERKGLEQIFADLTLARHATESTR